MLFTQLATSLLLLGGASATAIHRRDANTDAGNWVQMKAQQCADKYPGYNVMVFHANTGDFQSSVDGSSVVVDTQVHWGGGGPGYDKDYHIIVFKGSGSLKKLPWADGGALNWWTIGGTMGNNEITFQ